MPHQSISPTLRFTRLLPNIFTVSRGVLAILLVFAAAQQLWELSLLILILAIGSDFLDGLAAKYFHAESAFGAIADPIADCMLAAACVIGLYINGFVPAWLLIAMAASAAVIGYIKFLPHGDKLRAIVQSISVAYLFIVWLGAVWAYASLAYGWSWLYPLISMLMLAIAAALKRHRLAAWYGWLLSR